MGKVVKIKNQCNPKTGCCLQDNQIPRRDFLKLSSQAMASFAMPLSACDFISKTRLGHLIPANKMLSDKWIESLTERGIPELYTSHNDELKYIGMPIGGIGCGQLYISGDGRLWLWDIFQSNYQREKPTYPDESDVYKQWRLDEFSMGGLYSKPRISSEENNLYQVKNGFSIQYQEGKKKHILPLNRHGFNNITFRGEYPVARVSYKNAKTPLQVNLLTYSPFIPLNVKDSGIPATVLSYTIKNTGKTALNISIGGWLENTVCPNEKDIQGKRKNTIVREEGRTTVFMTTVGQELEKRKGYGNMAISLIGKESTNALADIEKTSVFEKGEKAIAYTTLKKSLIGGVSTSFKLEPKEDKTITFLVSWYFPYYNLDSSGAGVMGRIKSFKNLKRHYANYYTNADKVAAYVTNNFENLSKTTLKWNETWYNSTLPYWLLDRSFISINCLATQTSHLFDNGRFWGWEGVDCCEGTCTHVWQYAQAMARIFPSIERNLREQIDYGIAYDLSGAISFRAENLDSFTKDSFAIDGQLGTIIRVYREHQMTTDNIFLNRIWNKVKQSMQYVINKDNGNGLIEGKQENTLDAAWFGPMGWITGLYLVALKACEQMALVMEDNAFAIKCKSIILKGQKSLVENLFNGEYFIHLPPDYKSINTNQGCHIDQVLGQSFGYQVNLPDVLPKAETRSALEALWKYNFAPDAGQYVKDHAIIKGDRKYVLPGESGLLMTTWPIGGAEKAVPGMSKRPANSPFWIGPGGYFNECMNGFEYQAASHMVWEDMLTEGLSVMKAVHERYHGSKRNPYDEVECSSHYARSMASYGVYLAICGFHYNGPKGELGFAPKITPEDFKCAFTTAEAWGSFTQKIRKNYQENTLDVEYGNLRLTSLSFKIKKGLSKATLFVNGAEKHIKKGKELKKYKIDFESTLLKANDRLTIKFT
jgi:uncharacterized protein (DUF608 family)